MDKNWVKAAWKDVCYRLDNAPPRPEHSQVPSVFRRNPLPKRGTDAWRKFVEKTAKEIPDVVGPVPQGAVPLFSGRFRTGSGLLQRGCDWAG